MDTTIMSKLSVEFWLKHYVEISDIFCRIDRSIKKKKNSAGFWLVHESLRSIFRKFVGMSAAVQLKLSWILACTLCSNFRQFGRMGKVVHFKLGRILTCTLCSNFRQFGRMGKVVHFKLNRILTCTLCSNFRQFGRVDKLGAFASGCVSAIQTISCQVQSVWGSGAQQGAGYH